MKRSIIIMLVLLLCPISSVSASPVISTVSLSTGDVDLISGIIVRLTYSMQVQLWAGSNTIEPGQTSSGYISVIAQHNGLYSSYGSLSISVYIPSPVNDWYSTSANITSITYAEQIPIVSGLTATVRISPSASLSTSGPGSLDISSASFDYSQQSKSFTITAYSSAANGATITVNADFKLDINVGLSIDLFLFSQEVASASIGQFSMSPRVSENMTVSVPNPLIDFLTSPTFIFIALVALLGGLGVALIAAAIHKSSKKAEERRKRIPPPPPELLPPVEKIQPAPTRPPITVIYCIYCGEKLPREAVYCLKCGRKVNRF